ncbi:MAG TPA: hypothetical protein VFA83_19695 [Acidimicrobiales bacterium]|nr:hypothetical protein [Acidimicrobiales bacterium]
MTAVHLVKRFFGSLVPVGPSKKHELWAAQLLLPDQRKLWFRMSRVDRRHAVGVARRVERALGHEATPPMLAAALLHDVGKLDSGLGTYGRVIATLAGAAGGRDMAKDWSRAGGFTRRVGLYLRHAELGGVMLEMAGSDPLTSTWAREHHLPEDQWTLPPAIARALKDADDD